MDWRCASHVTCHKICGFPQTFPALHVMSEAIGATRGMEPVPAPAVPPTPQAASCQPHRRRQRLLFRSDLLLKSSCCAMCLPRPDAIPITRMDRPAMPVAYFSSVGMALADVACGFQVPVELPTHSLAPLPRPVQREV